MPQINVGKIDWPFAYSIVGQRTYYLMLHTPHLMLPAPPDEALSSPEN